MNPHIIGFDEVFGRPWMVDGEGWWVARCSCGFSSGYCVDRREAQRSVLEHVVGSDCDAGPELTDEEFESFLRAARGV